MLKAQNNRTHTQGSLLARLVRSDRFAILVVCVAAVLACTTRTASAEIIEVPVEVVEAAAMADVESMDLLGAVITTRLPALEYLYQVGELVRPVPIVPVTSIRSLIADVTWYAPTGNVMRNGVYPYAGAAACGVNIGFGSVIVFEKTGERYVCADTGYLRPNQVDVFNDPSAPRRLNGTTVIITR